jgi:hypothetical protein
MKRIRTLIEWSEPEQPGKHLVWHKPGEVADIDEVVVFDLADLIDSGAAMETSEMLTLSTPALTADEGTTPIVKGIESGLPRRGTRRAEGEDS